MNLAHRLLELVNVLRTLKIRRLSDYIIVRHEITYRNFLLKTRCSFDAEELSTEIQLWKLFQAVTSESILLTGFGVEPLIIKLQGH